MQAVETAYSTANGIQSTDDGHTTFRHKARRLKPEKSKDESSASQCTDAQLLTRYKKAAIHYKSLSEEKEDEVKQIKALAESKINEIQRKLKRTRRRLAAP